MSTNPNKLSTAEKPPAKPPVSFIDSLSKSMTSSMNSAMSSIDTSSLSEVNNKTAEQIERERAERERNQAIRDANETDPNDADTKSNIENAKKMKKGFNLMEVFKIVPIVVNVITKGPTLASGAVDVMVGLQKALVNTGLSLVDFFTSFFSFSIQGFKFAFILLVCFLENMANFQSCVIFYVLDLIILFAYLLLHSFLNLLDALFFEKMFGTSLLQMVLKMKIIVKQIEDVIFNISGLRLFQYPKCVQKMCYTCSVKSNKKQFKSTGSNFMNAISSRIPRMAMEPIRKFMSAGKKFASIFKV